MLAAADVSDALSRWLGTRFGCEVGPAEPADRLTGGFDFWTYAMRFGGACLPPDWRAPLIARVPPTTDRFALLERETRLQAWAAQHGYPAPAVVELVAPGQVFERPIQIVHRVPGSTMTASMTSSPWRVGRLVDRLAGLHARLHALPLPSWATGPEWSVVDRRLALVGYVLERLAHPELEAGLKTVGKILPRLDVPEPVLCHGDFHPMNVLVTTDRSAVIDWTDAGVGDLHCDVARSAWLFGFAAVAAPRRSERIVLRAIAPRLSRRYRHAYARVHAIDDDRVALWMPLHLLHAWAMTIADEHELVGPTRAGRDYWSDLGPWIRGEFHRAVARAQNMAA